MNGAGIPLAVVLLIAAVPDSARPPALQLITKVVLTTDADGGSARPEIAATADRVFVLHLANITGGNSRRFDVRIYDRELESLLATKQLVATTTQYGGPTDIRIASEGEHLYAFYETNKPISPGRAVTYLWGAKYALNDTFTPLAATTQITSSRPLAELLDGGELLDDPAPLLTPDAVCVITRLKYSLSTSGSTVYRVRQFSKDTLALLNTFDLDLSSVADGRGRVTSLLYNEGHIYIALATTVSDRGVNESNDDGAQSDIILVRLQQDWTFNRRTDVRSLSAEIGDRENYVSGFDTDGARFFVTYKQATGSPLTGQQRAIVKVFDKDFNLLHTEVVRSVAWGPTGGEMRPSLEVSRTRAFSGQSAGAGLGKGNAEIYVYEITRTRPTAR